MSRRGAGSAVRKTEFEFMSAPTLAQPVIAVAQQLLARGMTSAEVCSLFTHAAAVLSLQEDGLPRQEWLELCEELRDGGQMEAPVLGISAPGGSA